MIIPTIIMAIVAIGCLIYGSSDGSNVNAIKYAMSMSSQIFPMLFFALIIAGTFQSKSSPDFILNWLGNSTGIKGIFLGSLLGWLAPGGTLVTIPLASILLRSGAGVGATIAFFTSWSSWMLIRLPFEISVLGWKFTAIRLISTIIFPVSAGIIAHLLYHWIQVRSLN